MQGFERIEYILASFLGQPKNGTDSPQQQYNCPCCAQENGGVPDGKYNLEVNLLLGKYQCWKCSDSHGTKGNLGSLIRKYGGITLYKEYKSEINAIIKAKLYNLEEHSELAKVAIEKPLLKLPKTFKKIDLSKYCKQSVREYLEKRNIDQSIIDKFNIGYTEWEEEDKSMSYRLIIPSYDEFGNLNYYVGRDFLPAKESEKFRRTKYKNADGNKKEIIFQESLIDFDADIILVEGAIDCIYGPNTISMLGKALDKESYLYKSLREKANGRIIICLDSDTLISETKKIYSLLNYGRLKDKIWYIRMDEYKDFGEAYENEGKKGIIDLIKQSKQFSDFELVI